MSRLPFVALAVCAAVPAWAERREIGPLVIDGIPEIPSTIGERLAQYQNSRGAAILDWDASGKGMLIATRFGETSQVHRVLGPGTDRTQLTFTKEPIVEAHVDPQRAGGFYFRMDRGGGEFYQYYFYDLAAGRPTLVTDGKSRNEGMVVASGGGRYAYSSTARNGKDFDIWIGTGDAGQAKLVKELSGQWNVLDWSPDDRRLLLLHQISINEKTLHLLDVGSGDLTEVNPQNGARKIAYATARFGAGGHSLYYASDEDSEFTRLVQADLVTGRKELIAPEINWNIDRIEVSRDGRWLAYTANEGGTSALYLASTAQPKKAAKILLGPGVIQGLVFDPQSRRLAITLNAANAPTDVHVLELASKKIAQWTFSETGGPPREQFVAPSLIEFPSFDARIIPAWIYRPRVAGKRPVIIQIHGGPESQERPVFSPLYQYWVNELGVAVIAPNVRGSDGYGKSYLLLDNGFLREDSVKDIGALLDWIATQPDLDASRVAIAGGSYGGFMVLASLYAYPDRLRCGVDVVGISNFVTFLEHTEAYRRDLRRVEYGDEREPKMREFHERIAPLTNASRIRSPLFVAQGANDPRVPASEAEQIVANVRAAKGTVWYLLAKDEGHGFQKKTNKDFYQAAMGLFLEQFLLK